MNLLDCRLRRGGHVTVFDVLFRTLLITPFVLAGVGLGGASP